MEVEERLCEKCGTKSMPRFLNDVPICRACGAELSETGSTPSDEQHSEHCTLCDRTLPPIIISGKPHCSNCGTELAEMSETSSDSPIRLRNEDACSTCGSQRFVFIDDCKYCADCGRMTTSHFPGSANFRYPGACTHFRYGRCKHCYAGLGLH